jgi:hypothetical protein
MPLASFYSLPWNGPAAAAMVAQAESTTVAPLKALARAGQVVAAAASVPLAKPTRLVGRPATISGIGSMPLGLPKARARAAAIVRVGTLSQDDVTGGVLTAPVEGSLTLRDVLRVLLAVAAGKTTTTGSNVAFRDQADTKARVAASMTASQRTTVTIDPT